jgi:hypothetical protein
MGRLRGDGGKRRKGDKGKRGREEEERSILIACALLCVEIQELMDHTQV